MNNKSIMYSVLAFSLLIAIVCGVFLFASISAGADGSVDMTYEIDQSLSFKVVSWMLVGCIVAFLVFTFVFKKKFLKRAKFQSASYRSGSAFAAVLSLCLCAYGVATQVFSLVTGNSKNVLLQPPLYFEGIYWPNLLFIIALAVTAVYFIMAYCGNINRESNAFTALSLSLPITIAIKLVCDFLVQNTHGYSKLYNFHLVALAFLLLFSVNESRVYLRRAAPALYVFFGVAGSMAAIMYAIPTLFLNFTGVIKLDSVTNVIYCFVDILMVVYVYARLFSLGIKGTNDSTVISEPAVIFNEDKEM